MQVKLSRRILNISQEMLSHFSPSPLPRRGQPRSAFRRRNPQCYFSFRPGFSNLKKLWTASTTASRQSARSVLRGPPRCIGSHLFLFWRWPRASPCLPLRFLIIRAPPIRTPTPISQPPTMDTRRGIRQDTATRTAMRAVERRAHRSVSRGLCQHAHRQSPQGITGRAIAAPHWRRRAAR